MNTIKLLMQAMQDFMNIVNMDTKDLDFDLSDVDFDI